MIVQGLKVHENLSKFGKMVKLINDIPAISISWMGVVSERWRVSLYMILLQNITRYLLEGIVIIFLWTNYNI